MATWGFSEPREFCGTDALLWLTSGSRGLYRTDGTQAGTRRIAAGFTSVRQPLAFGGGVLFPGINSTTGFEIWFSDGTDTGTRLVHDATPGPTGSAWGLSAVGSRRAFYLSYTRETGEELASLTSPRLDDS